MDSPRRRWGEAQKRRIVAESAAMKILMRVRSFVPASALRVLGPHEAGSSNSEFFDREGVSLVRDVLAFVLLLTHLGTPGPSEWHAEPDPDTVRGDFAPQRWVDRLLEQARGSGARPGLNALALTAWALDGPLEQTIEMGEPWLWEALARALRPLWVERSDEGVSTRPGEIPSFLIPSMIFRCLSSLERVHVPRFAHAFHPLGPHLSEASGGGCD